MRTLMVGIIGPLLLLAMSYSAEAVQCRGGGSPKLFAAGFPAKCTIKPAWLIRAERQARLARDRRTF